MYICVHQRSRLLSRDVAMIEAAKHAIRALKNEQRPTKTGFVRTLIPDIDEAIAAGYTLKSIWERIRPQRHDLTYSEFCLYLRRARTKPTQTAAERGRKRDPDGLSDLQHGNDPLANIRRLENARPGFQYGGTQDLDVLVHGRRRNDGK
jgi:hypothetical protein